MHDMTPWLLLAYALVVMTAVVRRGQVRAAPVPVRIPSHRTRFEQHRAR